MAIIYAHDAELESDRSEMRIHFEGGNVSVRRLPDGQVQVMLSVTADPKTDEFPRRIRYEKESTLGVEIYFTPMLAD